MDTPQNQVPDPVQNQSTPVSPVRDEKSWVTTLLLLLLVIAGYMMFANFQSMWPFSPHVVVENPSPTPTTTPTPTPISANWETYTNTEHGFTFKYPRSFTVVNNGTGLLELNHASGNVYVDVKDKMFDPQNIEGMYGKIQNPEIRSMGERTAYAYTDGDAGCGGTIVSTGLNQRTLEISFVGCANDAPPILYEDTTLQNQILSTFTFSQ